MNYYCHTLTAVISWFLLILIATGLCLLASVLVWSVERCGKERAIAAARERKRERERVRERRARMRTAARAHRDRHAHVIKSVSLGFGFSVQCSVRAAVSLVWVSCQCHVWIWILQQLILMSGSCFTSYDHLSFKNAQRKGEIIAGCWEDVVLIVCSSVPFKISLIKQMIFAYLMNILLLWL